MKEVINITLGGMVFAIEHDAYETLADYIKQIKYNLTDTDDSSEIVSDIESAIAEKFIALKRSEKMAVVDADVNAVIAQMGKPTDFGEHDSSREMLGDEQDDANVKKRLYRDTDDSIVAGVASGLAQYFGIDPVIMRAVFVVSVFFNGLGILVYVLLWFIVPKAQTTTDKYAMRGEQLTIKEISERVKKNIYAIERADKKNAWRVWMRIRHVLDKLFRIFGRVLTTLARVLYYCMGIILVVGGALGLAGLVSVYSVVLLSEKMLFPDEVQIALVSLQSNALGIVAIISSFVMMAIPLVVLILAGAGVLAKRSYFTVQKAVALAVVWIIALVLAGTSSTLQAEQVMQDMQKQQTISEQRASTTALQAEGDKPADDTQEIQ